MEPRPGFEPGSSVGGYPLSGCPGCWGAAYDSGAFARGRRSTGLSYRGAALPIIEEGFKF